MTKWWKDDNGNKPRQLGPASERLLRTIARHDKGQGVHFTHLPGDRFQLVGTDYRVKRQTFHPFYDEYKGDHPSNGPLTDETSAPVGMYVHITDAGRAWIKAADKGEVEKPGRPRPPVRPAATPPAADVFLAATAAEVERKVLELTTLEQRLRGEGYDRVANLARAAREFTHDLHTGIEAERRRIAREGDRS